MRCLAECPEGLQLFKHVIESAGMRPPDAQARQARYPIQWPIPADPGVPHPHRHPHPLFLVQTRGPHVHGRPVLHAWSLET